MEGCSPDDGCGRTEDPAFRGDTGRLFHGEVNWELNGAVTGGGGRGWLPLGTLGWAAVYSVTRSGFRVFVPDRDTTLDRGSSFPIPERCL
jgi:hypothetical protein